MRHHDQGSVTAPGDRKGKLYMATAPDSHQRLREAGVITTDELPAEFAAVVEGLTPDELEMIIAVRKRLEEAGRVSGRDIGETWLAP